MITLARTIARQRVYYPRPIAALPDILMIDVSPAYAAGPLALGRYLSILIETIEEDVEISAFLEKARPGVVQPDLLDDRRSTLPARRITIAHYGPPANDWPYVQLAHWPSDHVAMISGRDCLFIRGAYTIDLFNTRDALDRASDTLLASLERAGRVDIEFVAPDWSPRPDGMIH